MHSALEADAVRAAETMNGAEWMGRKLSVELSKDRGFQPPEELQSKSKKLREAAKVAAEAKAQREARQEQKKLKKEQKRFSCLL